MIIRFRFILLALASGLALLLGDHAASAENSPWSRPTCTFAMPSIGHAVRKNQTGLINDILRTAFRAEGIRFRHEEMPYTRALAAVTEGTADITLGIEAGKDMLQSKMLVAFYDLSVAFMRGTPWQGTVSLKGKKVAFLHGFDISTFLSVPFLPQQVYDLTSAFHMLDRGFASYVLDDSLLLKDALFESRLPANEFIIKPIKSLEVHLLFAKTDQGRRFKDFFDRRYREMILDGELEIILERYSLLSQLERISKANGL